jgi:hypothetical protein
MTHLRKQASNKRRKNHLLFNKSTFRCQRQEESGKGRTSILLAQRADRNDDADAAGVQLRGKSCVSIQVKCEASRAMAGQAGHAEPQSSRKTTKTCHKDDLILSLRLGVSVWPSFWPLREKLIFFGFLCEDITAVHDRRREAGRAFRHRGKDYPFSSLTTAIPSSW